MACTLGDACPYDTRYVHIRLADGFCPFLASLCLALQLAKTRRHVDNQNKTEFRIPSVYSYDPKP